MPEQVLFSSLLFYFPTIIGVGNHMISIAIFNKIKRHISAAKAFISTTSSCDFPL